MTTYMAYNGPIKKYMEIVPRKNKKKTQVTLIPLALLSVILLLSRK